MPLESAFGSKITGDGRLCGVARGKTCGLEGLRKFRCAVTGCWYCEDMPIFEYSCDDCGTKFEKLVRRSEEGNGVHCPSCGQDHLTTQYSTFAAVGHTKKDSGPIGGCGGGMCQGGMCGMDLN